MSNRTVLDDNRNDGSEVSQMGTLCRSSVETYLFHFKLMLMCVFVVLLPLLLVF